VKAATGSSRFNEIKTILREHNLHTVCEEASCPNIGECFGKGTATFMIMGDKCTRRCPFCDVGHGRPDPLDADEPKNLARTIAALKLKYVVITSVDRDDLRDGGAAHFVECIRETRAQSPDTRIEILTPDFRGRLDRALDPERRTARRDEPQPRNGAAPVQGSAPGFGLRAFAEAAEGLQGAASGRRDQVGPDGRPRRDRRGNPAGDARHARARRRHADDRPVSAAVGAPSAGACYVHPDTFKMYEEEAYKMGFTHAAVGAMVRSSYHADQQAHGAGVV
jgi:lipoic acid synthetase